MDNNLPVSTDNLTESLKSGLIRLFIWSIVSFIVGFLLIFFFLKPSSEAIIPEHASLNSRQSAPKDALDAEPLPQNNSKQAVKSSTDDNSNDNIITTQNENEDVQDSKAEEHSDDIPPQDAPAGLTMQGTPYYLMCWDKSGLEHDSSQCDELETLEKRFIERLYVVKNCIDTKSGSNAYGKLSIATEINFKQNSISFWNGAASEITNADGIIECLRDKLSAFPLKNMDNKFERYRIFFTVHAGNDSTHTETSNNLSAPDAPPPGGDGRIVEVIKDKVRVRKAPVTGEIIGKISAPNKVRLIKKDGDWCNIVTPNNNKGWMICNALNL